MTITITYVETANSMNGIMRVIDPADPNTAYEYQIPKFFYSLIKAEVDAGTLDLQALWDRVENVSVSLPV